MLRAIGEPADDDARQTFLALEPHHVIAIKNRIEDKAARAVSDHLAPILHAGVGERRLADAEILSTRRVRGDEETIAVVLDGVFVPVLARLDDAGRAERRVGVDEVGLARLMVVSIDEDVLRRLRGAERDVEPDVLLLVDENVVPNRCADHVPVDLQRAVVLVEPHVEEGLAVVRPDQRSARVGN